MRKTYISAISFSTATSFQVFLPLVFEISDQFVEDVENNTLDAINIFSDTRAKRLRMRKVSIFNN